MVCTSTSPSLNWVRARILPHYGRNTAALGIVWQVWASETNCTQTCALDRGCHITQSQEDPTVVRYCKPWLWFKIFIYLINTNSLSFKNTCWQNIQNHGRRTQNFISIQLNIITCLLYTSKNLCCNLSIGKNTKLTNKLWWHFRGNNLLKLNIKTLRNSS